MIGATGDQVYKDDTFSVSTYDAASCENTRNTRTWIKLDSHIPVNPITVKSLTVMFTHVDS